MHPNFKQLVARVREINPQAADILLTCTILHPNPATDLEALMTWTHTEQGHEYWSRLHRLINYRKAIKEEDPKDGLTPVQRRCKKLWNNSNYVKNNPQRAY